MHATKTSWSIGACINVHGINTEESIAGSHSAFSFAGPKFQ